MVFYRCTCQGQVFCVCRISVTRLSFLVISGIRVGKFVSTYAIKMVKEQRWGVPRGNGGLM